MISLIHTPSGETVADDGLTFIYATRQDAENGIINEFSDKVENYELVTVAEMPDSCLFWIGNNCVMIHKGKIGLDFDDGTSLTMPVRPAADYAEMVRGRKMIQGIKIELPKLTGTVTSKQLYDIFKVNQEGEHEYCLDETGFAARTWGHYTVNELRFVADDVENANKAYGAYCELRRMQDANELFEVIQGDYRGGSESVYFVHRVSAEQLFAQNIINLLPCTMMHKGKTLYQYHPEAGQVFEFEIRMYASKDDKEQNAIDFAFLLPSKSICDAMALEYAGCYWIEIFHNGELIQEIDVPE